MAMEVIDVRAVTPFCTRGTISSPKIRPASGSCEIGISSWIGAGVSSSGVMRVEVESLV